jgi:glycosyltransferase involved in cell wall biosynthesis
MYNHSGIGTYLQNILPDTLSELSRHYQIVLLGRKSEENLFRKRINVTFIPMKSEIYTLKEQFEFLKLIPKDTEVVWSPHYNIPLLWRGKQLVTVHDIFHIAMKDSYKGFIKKLYAKFVFQSIRKKKSKIITVSEFTKKEMVELLNYNPSDIDVIHNGIDNEWRKSPSKLKEDYIVFVGNVKPHKNLKNLLEAYERIMDEYSINLKIIGKKEGFITGDTEVAKYADIYKERINFTGFISKEDLIKSVGLAKCMVFPSFYEGFGLPPLEAMACGCATIVSNAASIPEVCGDASLYFDPYNVDSIEAQLRYILSKSQAREQLITKGLERVKKFSWENNSNQTIGIILSLLEGK